MPFGKAELVVRVSHPQLGTLTGAAPLGPIAAKPPPVSAFRSRADEAMHAGKTARAAELFARMVKLHPEDPVALNSYAWWLLTVEEEAYRSAEDALELARKAVRLTDRRDGAILDTFAKALHDTGELAEAIQCLEEAARLLPANAEVQERLRRYRQEAAAADD
jgi:tetratricopeptide (TPR) repeat protein